MKTFLLSFRRYYGEMKDDFTEQVSGESELDVLFNYLCGWEIVHADEFAERDSKCREWLEEEIGEDWTLKKFFDKHIELWAAQDLCFEIYDIREGEIKYVYK